MFLRIYKDEAYPVYLLRQEDDEGGWIPEVTLPDGALTADELADHNRVEALYDAWQSRLSDLYKLYDKPVRPE